LRFNADAVNPERTGTKVAAHHVLKLGAGESASIRLRLTGRMPRITRARGGRRLGSGFERVMSARRAEVDAFYATVIPPDHHPA
jgi:hypothetical protein